MLRVEGQQKKYLWVCCGRRPAEGPRCVLATEHTPRLSPFSAPFPEAAEPLASSGREVQGPWNPCVKLPGPLQRVMTYSFINTVLFMCKLAPHPQPKFSSEYFSRAFKIQSKKDRLISASKCRLLGFFPPLLCCYIRLF